MSEIITNLKDLGDKFVPEEETQEQENNTSAVPEQKASLKDRMDARRMDAMQKAIDKKKAKLKAFQEKKLAKEEHKSEKTKLSKGKIIAGAAIGLGIIGVIGKTLMDCAERYSDAPCEEAENICTEPSTETVPVEESES